VIFPRGRGSQSKLRRLWRDLILASSSARSPPFLRIVGELLFHFMGRRDQALRRARTAPSLASLIPACPLGPLCPLPEDHTPKPFTSRRVPERPNPGC
jgi:hypothetical protein